MVVPDEPGQNVTLDAGETVVYLFPATRRQFAGAVHIEPPGGAYKAVLHYSYIYKEALTRQLTGIECTRGCILRLDRNLGPVFYQFDYVNLANSMAGRSYRIYDVVQATSPAEFIRCCFRTPRNAEVTRASAGRSRIFLAVD